MSRLCVKQKRFEFGILTIHRVTRPYGLVDTRLCTHTGLPNPSVTYVPVVRFKQRLTNMRRSPHFFALNQAGTTTGHSKRPARSRLGPCEDGDCQVNGDTPSACPLRGELKLAAADESIATANATRFLRADFALRFDSYGLYTGFYTPGCLIF